MIHRELRATPDAGRLLIVCTGEVQAFSETAPDDKMIAHMQATIVGVAK